MPMTHFLQKAERLDLQTNKQMPDPLQLKKTHVPFTGSLHTHPSDKSRVVLVADPTSSSPYYYEFNSGDVAFAQELQTLTNLDGEAIPLVRIWVRKQSIGVRCAPFRVDDLSGK